jgi:hypothetical protein
VCLCDAAGRTYQDIARAAATTVTTADVESSFQQM